MIKIPLSQNKFALIDDEDYERVSTLKWILTQTAGKNPVYYVMHRSRKWKNGKQIGNAKKIHLHRFIMNVTDPKVLIDHADHNGLNNQKSNLRICTGAQNSKNRLKTKIKKSSIYKGVTLTNKGVWQSLIKSDGIQMFLGNFTTELSAAIAYNHAAIKYHKEFAWLNNIPNWENIKILPKGGLRSNKYKGIKKNLDGRTTWGAYIRVNGINENLGYYSSEESAAIAYNKRAIEIFGNKAYINPIDNWENIEVSPAFQRRSIYHGIYINNCGNWRVSIRINKVTHHVGTFKTEEEAALAYNKKALDLLGDKAKLNIIT